MKPDETNDFYIFKYDVLSDKINKIYNEYISKPKKKGGAHKELDFRWLDLKYMDDSDKKRMNNWGILGF